MALTKRQRKARRMKAARKHGRGSCEGFGRKKDGTCRKSRRPASRKGCNVITADAGKLINALKRGLKMTIADAKRPVMQEIREIKRTAASEKKQCARSVRG